MTRHQKKDDLSACSQVVQLARVGVRVIVLVVDVVCLNACPQVLVLLFMLYSYSFRSQFSVVGGILFTLQGARAPISSGRCPPGPSNLSVRLRYRSQGGIAVVVYVGLPSRAAMSSSSSSEGSACSSNRAAAPYSVPAPSSIDQTIARLPKSVIAETNAKQHAVQKLKQTSFGEQEATHKCVGEGLFEACSQHVHGNTSSRKRGQSGPRSQRQQFTMCKRWNARVHVARCEEGDIQTRPCQINEKKEAS